MSLLTEAIGARCVFDPDYVFDAAALPNATTATSSAFKIGGALLGLEIVGIAGTEITIASEQTITYALHTSDTEGGSFTLSDTIVVLTTGTVALGAEMFRFAGNTNTKQWGKIVVTTTANQSSDTHTVQLERVPR